MDEEEEDSTIKRNIRSLRKRPPIKEIDLNSVEIGSHLQKDKEGNIYRFSKHHFNKGNNVYVFYCSDPKCNAKSLYYENMVFETIKGHKIKYSEHCYVKNKDKDKDKPDKYAPIIEEFEQRDCHEAQIFKKQNGKKIVKWYD